MAKCKISWNFKWLLYGSMIGAMSIPQGHSFGQNKSAIQDKRCPVTTINYEQGLMNNSIWGVITDARGFTFVSTKTGLQKYNGYSMETITPVASGDTIHINYPVHFLKGKNNSILIGYKNGVLEYNPENKTFRKLIVPVRPENARYAMLPLKQTDEGLWCLDETKGIVLYQKDGITSRQFPTSEPINSLELIGTGDYVPRKLVTANDDFIFIRLSPDKILEINTNTHELKSLDYPGAGIMGIECNKVKIFITSAEQLAFIRISDGNISNRFYYKQLPEGGATRTSVALSHDDVLLVSVDKRLFEFDTACNCKKEITSPKRETVISTGFIHLVYEDMFRRIWLLTNDDIKRVQNVEIPFAHFIYPGEKNNFVRCLYYDNDKNILLAGCFNGGIQLYDSSANALWDKSLITPAVKDIVSIEKLSEDHYLVVTMRKGLYLLSLKAKKLDAMHIDSVSSRRFNILENSYSSGFQRIDGSTVFISTRSNVFSCHIQKNTISAATGLLQDAQVKGYFITCFIYTADKSLWAGTASGVLLVLDNSGSFRVINIPENYDVRSIAEDRLHHIWVGTERGLFVYDNSGQVIFHATRETGLSNDFIYALLPADGASDFFASTNLGLSFISGDGKIKNYARELGLQESEFNTQSCAKSSSGRLFFGGVNGITAFYPLGLSSVKDSSLINITRFVVNDSSYNTLVGDSVSLAYNQNHLQFDIAATGLLNPNEYVYRYRLKGFEESLQTTNQPTGIHYTVDPGNYFLEINWSPILSPNTIFHKTIRIIIEPPWWKTWWFVSVSIIIAAFGIFLVSYFIIWQRYQLKLEKLEVKQQLIGERERISRELHDNIGSQLSYISSNIDWLVEAPESFSEEEETKRLSIVSDTAKGLVADLRETIWAMKKEYILLDELADKMKSFLQSQCILQPQMEMTIIENIQKKYSFSPTEALNIFRICQEAIVNCIRHSQAEKILLHIQSGTDEDFSFTIEDNGKGFIRQKNYNGHYGLENMTHRASESGASLLIFSEPGKGTTITIVKQTRVKNASHK